MNQGIKVAVVGASGYTGMELLRLLLMHENVEVVCVTSRQYEGKALGEVFPRLNSAKGGDLKFVNSSAEEVSAAGAETVFLALPHGVAASYAVTLLQQGLRVVDLSADFRVHDPKVYEEFYGAVHPAPELLPQAVYGLPEVRAAEIAKADLVASPGCYPTSIILPLLPLLREQLIDTQSIVTCSMSGVSGAGKSANLAFSYCEANESARAYGLPKHRHLSEIEQELSEAANESVCISFTPHLVPMHSGICSTTSAVLTGEIKQVAAALERAYASAHFIRLLGQGGTPDTKNVTRTNYIDIGWSYDPRTRRILLLSAEDNLGKGAAGQAIQSFNLMHGLDEDAGLLNY